MEAFWAYLEDKRKLGAWGDDIELTALCNLYDRTAEVWSYADDSGAKKIRTFHENFDNAPKSVPIRFHIRKIPLRFLDLPNGFDDTRIGYVTSRNVITTLSLVQDITKLSSGLVFC